MVPARSGVGYAVVCSGTLVSPTVFLTASHCTAFLEADPRPEFVTFDETEIEPVPSGLIPATARTNPAYKGGGRDDVSVMVLATPVTTITPAQLPALGYLDTLPLDQSTRLTVVGYGTSEKVIVKGEKGPQFPFAGDRGYGIGGFNSLTPQWLKMSQNAAHGDSGACYGDSGGPTFLGAAPNDGDVVLAVTTTGDTPCYSTNVASRTDSPSARAFLSSFGL
jgi:secreted trypsin-like serine protease